MIRKAVSFLLISAFFVLTASADDSFPRTSAGAAILVHPASGRVLYAKNANKRMLMASTTKLMTALTAAQMISPETTAEIKEEWTRIEGSSMYLRPGELCSVRELLEGLLLASGNDAALALAGLAGGDTESFVAAMNAKAAEMGLDNTHFDNPHGLDSPGQYSTAADLAVIMQEVCREPVLREIIGMRYAGVGGRVLENHNKLLRSCRGVFGGKTGYTKAAGRCLATCCERDGMELICVTLSDPDDWRDHEALYDWAYGKYHQVTVGETLPLKVIGGEADAVYAAPEADAALCLEENEGYTVEFTLPPFLFAPVLDGEQAGLMTVQTDGGAGVRIRLRCRGNVPADLGVKRALREIVDRFIGIYAV